MYGISNDFEYQIDSSVVWGAVQAMLAVVRIPGRQIESRGFTKLSHLMRHVVQS